MSDSWCGTCGKDKPDDGHSDCESCRKWWEENRQEEDEQTRQASQ